MGLTGPDAAGAAWWHPSRWLGRRAAPDDGQIETEVRALVAQERMDDALALLQEAVARSSGPELLTLLGALHFKRGEGAQAVAAIESALRVAPQSAQLHNLLGMCHMLSGNEAAALPCFVRATELEPRLAQAQANAGWLSFAMQQPSSGYFRRWLELVATEPRLEQPRLSLPQVTLVCVDCAYHTLAIQALRESMARCEFGAVKFFTDRDFDLPGIEVVRVGKIASAADYSNFMIHQLRTHIDTGFALVVQYDGFVLNPQAWTAEFLDYDYLGALIPATGEGLVGNGGFSLRSAKLLKALADPVIAQYDARNHAWQEDMAICVEYRARLQAAHGVRIAPASLAQRFAVEFTRPHEGAFGFHGLTNVVHLAERGFSGLEPADTRRLPLTLRADTPLGPLCIANSIETLGHPKFGDEALARLAGLGGAA